MEMACSEPLWRAFSFEFERLCAVLRRNGSNANVPVDEDIFFPRRAQNQAAYTDSHFFDHRIRRDHVGIGLAAQDGHLDTMQRMDENRFPDGLDMLRVNNEEQLEQRRERAAIKASKKAHNAMKIATTR
jgi:hypothetical protein